ncbi:MAG: TIGR00701 family protein [Rhodobacterales bacterium]|nr:MAG: TIGR00701 family protein [Rhodobacterales bacterium]
MWEAFTDFLSDYYLWTKSLHIIAVIPWMAGLFYLPRLFVYHVEVIERGIEPEEVFHTMERKLLKIIMNPAMTVSLFFGTLLLMTPGIVDWSSVWIWLKLAAIALLCWFHVWLIYRRRDFAAGQNTRSGKQYRIMNEMPTVLMIIIVFSVVLKY